MTFEVDHVTDPVPYGVYGTADDITVDLERGGHGSGMVIDRDEADLNGEAKGNVVTEWHVNPDASLNKTFLLNAARGGGSANASLADGLATLSAGGGTAAAQFRRRVMSLR
ncbi:MAG: hypothetical protein IE919_08920 [Thioclava sp.]|nr:hypothetical protein [Thioclava sp.]MBD3803351.1 hypothetical protein [Thioclava sp.]